MCVCILFWRSSLPVVCFCRGIDLSQLTVAHSRSQISQLWLKSRYEEDSITSGCLIQSIKTLQSAKLSNIAKLFKSIDINRPKLCARCPIGIKGVVVIKSKENATHLFLPFFYPKNGSFPTPSESFNHQCPSSNFSPRRVAASFQQREARGNGSTTWRGETTNPLGILASKRWCLGVFHVAIQRLMFTSRLSVTFRLSDCISGVTISCHVCLQYLKLKFSVVDKVEKVRLAEGNT